MNKEDFEARIRAGLSGLSRENITRFAGVCTPFFIRQIPI
jgi:hypothetical protein